MEEATLIVKPETVKKWYRKLIAKHHDYSHLRKKNDSWHNFIKQHKAVWAADFFTVDIKPHVFAKFFITYYIIFFIHIHSRRTVLGGITPYPDEEWMKQTARNLTGFDGELINASHLIHDQDTKYTGSFDELFRSSGIEPLKLPVQSLNLNTYAKRFVRSIREECLSKQNTFSLFKPTFAW